MDERDAVITEDNGVRREIDTCTENLTRENEKHTILTTQNATCAQNLSDEIGYTQNCNTSVTNTEREITYLDIQQSNTQAALEECNWVHINGNRPPKPPNNAASSAIQQAVAQQEKQGVVYHYVAEKAKCDVDLNNAIDGWNRRHPPQPPPSNNRGGGGCVIL